MNPGVGCPSDLLEHSCPGNPAMRVRRCVATSAGPTRRVEVHHLHLLSRVVTVKSATMIILMQI